MCHNSVITHVISQLFDLILMGLRQQAQNLMQTHAMYFVDLPSVQRSRANTASESKACRVDLPSIQTEEKPAGFPQKKQQVASSQSCKLQYDFVELEDHKLCVVSFL